MEMTQYAMGALVKGHKLDLIEFKPPALAANVSCDAHCADVLRALQRALPSSPATATRAPNRTCLWSFPTAACATATSTRWRTTGRTT